MTQIHGVGAAAAWRRRKHRLEARIDLKSVRQVQAPSSVDLPEGSPYQGLLGIAQRGRIIDEALDVVGGGRTTRKTKRCTSILGGHRGPQTCGMTRRAVLFQDGASRRVNSARPATVIL